MSETVTIPSSDAPPKSEAPSSAGGNKPLVQIAVRGTNSTGSDAAPDKAAQEKIIASLAKSYEAIVDRIVGLFDGAGVRIVRKRARKLFSETQTEEFCESVKLTDEARETAKVAASRIAARRVTNPEVMDWLALGSVVADWGTNLRSAINELKEIEKARQKNNGQVATDGNENSPIAAEFRR